MLSLTNKVKVNDEGPQRILLAGPTILYFPLYLAWLNCNETAREQIEFWIPDYAPKADAGSDALMSELFREDGPRNILFCIGDLLRAYDFIANNRTSTQWSRQLLVSPLINTLPVVGYAIDDLNPPGQKAVYMCHAERMSTWEVAEVLKKRSTQIELFPHVKAGYERQFVESVLEYTERKKKITRTRNRIILICQDVMATGSFTGSLVKDPVITSEIAGMCKDGRYLLTSIIRGNSGREDLRTHFLEKLHQAIDMTRKDPESAANTFYSNVRYINKFGNVKLNELTEVVARLSGSYCLSNTLNTALRDGLVAAAKVRYNYDCGHTYRPYCPKCGVISHVMQPFPEGAL